MKRKKEKYLPLDFCGKLVLPDMMELKKYEQYLVYCRTHRQELERILFGQAQYMEPTALAPLLYTAKDWLSYKQSYRITKEFAEDLFTSENMDFPLEDIRLPFPTIFLDFEELDDEEDEVPLGAFCTLSEVPMYDGKAHMCSLIFLIQTPLGLSYDGIAFDYKSSPMSVEENIQKYAGKELQPYCRHVIQFAAYIASYEPDVEENPVQKTFYKASSKPKASSVRKWDVGIRYREMKSAYASRRQTGSGRGGEHQSPRPHVRRGHWHTYHVGKGRKETRLKWLAPFMVGKGEATVIVTKVE